MKGKTGKSAMRGGGMARKGVGAALKGGGGVGKALRQLSPIAMAVKGEMPKMGLLGMAVDALKKDKEDGIKAGRNPADVKKDLGLKGGGMARKGVGMALKDGGKAKKMAVGGAAGVGEGRRNDLAIRPGDKSPMVRPGFPSRGPIRPFEPGKPPVRPVLGQNTGGQPIGLFGQPNKGNTPKPPGTPSLAQVAAGMNAVGSMATGVPNPNGPNPRGLLKKNGGKVSKYAKGGAVKMTAGAGSGSGRLEKVANHKSAKRVPAQNLKHGGKAKGK